MSTGGASGSELPDETSAAGRPKDLRVGSHRDIGVRIDRDLTGSGRLVRGSTTGYSTLRFSSGPRPEAADVEPPAAPSRAAAKASAAPGSAAPGSAAVGSVAAASAAPARTEGSASVTERVSHEVTGVTTAAAPAVADFLSPPTHGPAEVPADGRRARPVLARLARWFGRA